MNLDTLSRKELLSMRDAVEAALETLETRRKSEARKAAAAIAAEHGFDLEELLSAEKKTKKKEKDKITEGFASFAKSKGGKENKGKFYFYNITSLGYGQNEFRNRWGNRELSDDWRGNSSVSENASRFSRLWFNSNGSWEGDGICASAANAAAGGWAGKGSAGSTPRSVGASNVSAVSTSDLFSGCLSTGSSDANGSSGSASSATRPGSAAL